MKEKRISLDELYTRTKSRVENLERGFILSSIISFMTIGSLILNGPGGYTSLYVVGTMVVSSFIFILYRQMSASLRGLSDLMLSLIQDDLSPDVNKIDDALDHDHNFDTSGRVYHPSSRQNR